MPSIYHHSLQELSVVVAPDVLLHSHSVALVGHLYEDLITQPDQFPYCCISLNFREFCVRVIHNVVSLELRTISIESVGDEHRNVIHPSIAWSGGEKDPPVSSSDSQEFGNPLTTTDNSLLVEDEERPTNGGILSNVIPRIDRENTRDSRPRNSSHGSLGKLPLPIARVSLLGCRDDVDILWCFFLHIVGNGCQGFPRPDTAPQDLAVR